MTMMTSLWQDLRYGVRMLAKSPGFTAVAVVTLGLGIGATTAVFSVLDHVALRPLPYRNPDELVLASFTSTDKRYHGRPITKAELMAWQSDDRVFSGLTAFWYGGGTWTGGAEPVRIAGKAVLVNFFDVLGVEAMAGRTFTSEDAEPDAEPVLVVSYPFWQGRLAGDPNVLGTTITIDDRVHTVIGVLAPGFKTPQDQGAGAQIWRPLEQQESFRAGKGWLIGVGRLRPGVSFKEAQNWLTTLVAGVPNTEFQPRGTAVVESVHEELFGYHRRSLLVLFGAVTFVLLIGCLNVAHLLLVRSSARRREMAVRKALGAGKGRLIRQLVVESSLLSLLGCGLAVLVAAWSLPLLLSMAPAWMMPRLDQVAIDSRILAFAVGLSFLTTLAFGLAPAVQSAKRPLREALQTGTAFAAGSTRDGRFRDALVVAEIALSLVLLIGGGLLIRTYWQSRPVDVGFTPQSRLVAKVDLPWGRGEEAMQEQRLYFREALRRLRSTPMVEEVAGMDEMPFPDMSDVRRYSKPGETATDASTHRPAYFWKTTPNYFRVMEIPLLAGVPFDNTAGENSTPIAIVNETLAKTLWPDENPLGRTLNIHAGDEAEPHTVIAVAQDTRTSGNRSGLDAVIYVPFEQHPSSMMTFVMKTPSDPETVIPAVREQLLAMAPDRPLKRLDAMEHLLWGDVTVVRTRFYAWLMGAFSGLALLLATIGVFGVISYVISRRTKEIGLRMALGAQQNEILGLVLRRGLKLVLAGIAVGVAASLGLTRLIAGHLAEVTPTDPATFIAMSVLLVAVAAIAILLPARRAARVDPMTALRYE